MLTVKEFTKVFTWKVKFHIKMVGYNSEDYGMWHMNTIPEDLKNRYIYLVDVTEDGIIEINIR